MELNHSPTLDARSSEEPTKVLSAKTEQSEGQSRVCDTCRICSNERPICASCRDNGWTCTYSLKRKRPGPVPGSRRKKQPSAPAEATTTPATTTTTTTTSSTAATSTADNEGRNDDKSISNAANPPSLASSASPNSGPSTHVGWDQNSYPLGGATAQTGSAMSAILAQSRGPTSHGPAYEFSVSKEQSLVWFQQNTHHMITLYFEYINACYPFMSMHQVEDMHRLGRVPRFLLLAMSALAIRFMPGDTERFVDNKPRSEMARHMARQALDDLGEKNDLDLPIDIHEVQATVMLTLFEYTRKPGRRAWEQTGKLARMAYTSGLHLVDQDPCPPGDQHVGPSPAEKDLRRHLWWTIWRLDSYAGVVTGTPFNIQTYEIATRLPGRPNGIEDQQLAGDVSGLWRSLWIHDQPRTPNALRNMFIVVGAVMRETSIMTRMLKLGQSHDSLVEGIQSNWHYMRQHTPSWFWDPVCDEMFETPETHRLRLECLLQFHLLEVGGCFAPMSFVPREKGVEKLDMDVTTRWRSIVGVAERVATNFRHWKRSYFMRSEAFACFLPWMAALVFKLEQCRLGEEDLIAKSTFENTGLVMEVALAQMGSVWELATMLLDSLHKIKALTSSNLPPQVLIKIMAGCFAPLNTKQSMLTADLKPGPDFLTPMKVTSLPDAIIDPVSESQLLNLPDEILNFTFQSPFLEGIAEEWHFAYP